ncbi:MAG: DUF423 domain-containing protein [Verrucomicrobiae bacterium]|nr:DUF423 domain-containing protein [Verrucomicrobiae bacterium]
MPPTQITRLGAVVTLVGIALGAFGAHALKEVLEAGDHVDTWHTGVFYHLIHGVALTALGLSGRRQKFAVWAWLIGVILFSGSIYGLCLLENARWLGPVTPLGGLSMMAGWLALAIRPPKAEA